jgi:hypothetical protein
MRDQHVAVRVPVRPKKEIQEVGKAIVGVGLAVIAVGAIVDLMSSR